VASTDHSRTVTRTKSGRHRSKGKDAAPLERSTSFTLSEYCNQEFSAVPSSTSPQDRANSPDKRSFFKRPQKEETFLSIWINGLKKAPEDLSQLIQTEFTERSQHPKVETEDGFFFRLQAAWLRAHNSSPNPEGQLQSFARNPNWYRTTEISLSTEQILNIIKKAASELNIETFKEIKKLVAQDLKKKRGDKSTELTQEPPPHKGVEMLLASKKNIIDALEEQYETREARSKATDPNTVFFLNLLQIYHEIPKTGNRESNFFAFALDDRWGVDLPSDQRLAILLQVADKFGVNRDLAKHVL
jgi:hypothetical protein